MNSTLVISIDELWLKGKNRATYLRAATTHIAAVFKHYHSDKFSYKVQSERLYYTSKTEFGQDLLSALTCVPGLAYISPCKILPRLPEESMENVYEEVVTGLKHLEGKPFTFRAMVKRIDKSFTQTSVFIGREIGHRVLNHYPLAKVNLKTTELVVDVRILPNHVVISTETRKGMGGLPWGSTGSAVTMLSGGFDSPVASYLMAKRGVRQSFVFFHAYPFVGREVIAKIKSLTKELAKFQRQTHLYIVPFGEIQSRIAKECREEYRTLIFRRYMIEFTNKICELSKADAIITGDCVGQVSSQTMKNLFLMDKVSDRIILRPLVGFNKLEILNLAATINTHDISILPHDDACAMFAPKSPILNPNMDYWKNWDKDFDLSSEFSSALEKTEVYSVNLVGDFYKKDEFSFDA